MPFQVLDHPLVGHLLASLRDRDTEPQAFRHIARRLTTLLVLQATWPIRTKKSTVVTPLAETEVRVLDQGIAVVPVLRAGLGMLEPVLDLFPDVAVGYIGLERHEETAIAHSYYSKIPRSIAGRYTLCVDPMLATGGSAAHAISAIKRAGATQVTMVCVVAAPEGVERLTAAHPDVSIIAAALDERLNEQKYIVPGLGDFGDRLYGTP